MPRGKPGDFEKAASGSLEGLNFYRLKIPDLHLAQSLSSVASPNFVVVDFVAVRCLVDRVRMPR